jgi:hypothetical protein
MQLDGKYSQAFFGIAVINLVVILVELRAHVPVNCALSTIIPLIEILSLSLMSARTNGAPDLDDKMVALAVAQPDELREVAKRVQLFGIDGEHPHLTRADWMRAIASDQTQASYWEWVTKNEMLAERLLSVPGMTVRTGRGTKDQPTSGIAGLKLVPSRK